MSAMVGWTTRSLRELADIRVSNVDKKFHTSERPVKLCNYLDVYTNEYLTGKIQFMEASATPAEIERFSLNRGDVIITKDSESPDDIGIPTVILEEIDDLVCGYHLALIRPNHELLDPIYLAKQISTSNITRYFAINASGSTRFGLSISTIENAQIQTPPKPEQVKITEILSTVDLSIEQTELLIAKQQRIKTGLMQDLLTRGIDEQGNLRHEETHEFKDSPLGRIPMEWEVASVSSVLTQPPKNGYSPVESSSWNGMYMLGLGCLTFEGFRPNQLKYAPKADRKIEAALLTQGDFLISRSNTRSLVGLVGIFIDVGEPCIYPDLMVRLRFGAEVSADYMEQVFMSPVIRRQIENAATGTSGSMVKISAAAIKNFLFSKPPLEEQLTILPIIQSKSEDIQNSRAYLIKLYSLKTSLMQDLLTGKKRVNALMNEMEVAGI